LLHPQLLQLRGYRVSREEGQIWKVKVKSLPRQDLLNWVHFALRLNKVGGSLLSFFSLEWEEKDLPDPSALASQRLCISAGDSFSMGNKRCKRCQGAAEAPRTACLPTVVTSSSVKPTLTP
jgi:hypothetical protein